MKMYGLSKALPVALALAAAILITTSCGTNPTSSNLAQVRAINAIADGPTLDIQMGGSSVFTSLAFGAIEPVTASATYVNVAAGSVTVEGLATGTTTNPIAPIGTITLKTSTLYTMIAVGPELNESPPLLLTDDNTAPVGTNVKFRIINVSPSSPVNGVDVYIVALGVTDLTNYRPQITGLGNAQASLYLSLPFLAGGYNVIVTQSGFKSPPLITQPVTANASSITTIVILDNAGGNNGTSSTPLVLHDLN